MTRERRQSRPFQQTPTMEADVDLPSVRPELVEHLRAVFSASPDMAALTGTHSLTEQALALIALTSGQDTVIDYLDKLSKKGP